MTAASLVVTGTDLGVGKTTVALAILGRAASMGWRTAAYKPVAAGCRTTAEGLRAKDARALQKAATERHPYARVNPYAFESAITPYLAAEAAGERVRLQVLNDGHAFLAERADLVIIEGTGGWLEPLNPDISFGGWVAQQGWPVLLVVGLRPGCLNHALLTAEAMGRRSQWVGWVASGGMQRMPAYEETLAALKGRLSAPFWGELLPGAVAIPDLKDAPLEALRAMPSDGAE